MTEPGDPTPAPTGSGQREELLAEAVRVLTEAARLTRPVLEPAGANGAARWVESGRREPADWAESVTQALAGAAANVGGVEAVLAGRPGSWEADGVRQLLTSTVGQDEQYLLGHRTEPVVVDLYVDEILVDLDVWKAYDDAQQELSRRYDTLDISTAAGVPGDPATDEALARLEPATEEQERAAEVIGDLEDRLERQRQQDWAAYGQNLRAAVEAAAQRRPGLRVPVIVHVDLDTFRPGGDQNSSWTWDIAEQLRTEAVTNTPPPGDGRPPLDRLQQDGP